MRGIANGGVTPSIGAITGNGDNAPALALDAFAFAFASGFGVALAFALTAFPFGFGSSFGVAVVFAAFRRRSADSDAGRFMVSMLKREDFSRGP